MAVWSGVGSVHRRASPGGLRWCGHHGRQGDANIVAALNLKREWGEDPCSPHRGGAVQPAAAGEVTAKGDPCGDLSVRRCASNVPARYQSPRRAPPAAAAQEHPPPQPPVPSADAWQQSPVAPAAAGATSLTMVYTSGIVRFTAWLPHWGQMASSRRSTARCASKLAVQRSQRKSYQGTLIASDAAGVRGRNGPWTRENAAVARFGVAGPVGQSPPICGAAPLRTMRPRMLSLVPCGGGDGARWPRAVGTPMVRPLPRRPMWAWQPSTAHPATRKPCLGTRVTRASIRRHRDHGPAHGGTGHPVCGPATACSVASGRPQAAGRSVPRRSLDSHDSSPIRGGQSPWLGEVAAKPPLALASTASKAAARKLSILRHAMGRCGFTSPLSLRHETVTLLGEHHGREEPSSTGRGASSGVQSPAGMARLACLMTGVRGVSALVGEYRWPRDVQIVTRSPFECRRATGQKSEHQPALGLDWRGHRRGIRRRLRADRSGRAAGGSRSERPDRARQWLAGACGRGPVRVRGVRFGVSVRFDGGRRAGGWCGGARGIVLRRVGHRPSLG